MSMGQNIRENKPPANMLQEAKNTKIKVMNTSTQYRIK